MAVSVTVTLTLRQQHSSEATSPAIADIHQASHCSRCFASLTAIASIG
jgi:hypothetical protein